MGTDAEILSGEKGNADHRSGKRLCGSSGAGAQYYRGSISEYRGCGCKILFTGPETEEKLDDLAGKNVVVQAASAALDALNSDDNKDLTASFASLTENPDYNTAFMNLDSGAADAIAVDIGVAKYQLSQREEGKYVILDEPIQSEQYGIGFKKGNDELKDTVWEEVLKLYDAGEVDKLAEKYEVADMLCIGDDEKSDDKKDDAAEDGASDADTAKEDTADTAKDAE